ncbi:CIR protein [Plasmodium chabaudi adami]|uniref:CIR protein n=1 Tax=Plasmodium chabaudi adami TaxID=5826 RepID=A0A1D3L985_PLACE|nr:CIR protein [Plasmodium chabaudi adami]
MNKNVCKLFIDVDKSFKKGTGNVNKFDNTYTKYCPEEGCNTNYDKISALCEYLLEELPKNDDKQKGSEHNVYRDYEYIFMWLADNFLKITPDHSYTLNEYYDEVIANHDSNFNCWGKFDNKKHFKYSNISIMSVFYQLFMNICNAVVENDISKLETKKFMMIDHNYCQIYELINSDFSDCDPYVQLFINLKNIYDKYRNLAIKQIPKDQHDSVNSLTRPEINNKDNEPQLKFQSNGCKELHLRFYKLRIKPKPKKKPRILKSPSNGLKIKKDAEKNKGFPQNTGQSTIKENQSLEPKTSGIPQNGNTQVQTLSKSPENIQEGSPNNNPVSSDGKDASKDTGSVSENHVDKPEIAKKMSKGDISLPETPPPVLHDAPLFQLPDTESDPKKSIKQENLQNFTLQNQDEPSKTKTTNSPSLENSESESLNFEKIIYYSVSFFKAYSSLFNSTVNIIEDYIQNIVLSKISDIVDKITKYQQIIQTINFPKDQIQTVNDQQKSPEKSQKEKVEQSTKITERTTGSLGDVSSKLVNEPENNVIGLNGNISKLLSFKFEGYKVVIMALIVVSIPIVLAIMYKYLYYGCGKKPKKKKKLKKIINSIDGKNTEKTVINLIGGKNITIQSIKSSSPKTASSNVHKHIFSNSAPFINLFFLLIFFVCKRKYNSL